MSEHNSTADIWDFNVPNGIYRAITLLQVHSLEELAKKTALEIIQLKGCGPGVVKKVKKWLGRFGLRLAENSTQPPAVSADIIVQEWQLLRIALTDLIQVENADPRQTVYWVKSCIGFTTATEWAHTVLAAAASLNGHYYTAGSKVDQMLTYCRDNRNLVTAQP